MKKKTKVIEEEVKNKLVNEDAFKDAKEYVDLKLSPSDVNVGQVPSPFKTIHEVSMEGYFNSVSAMQLPSGCVLKTETVIEDNSSQSSVFIPNVSVVLVNPREPDKGYKFINMA